MLGRVWKAAKHSINCRNFEFRTTKKSLDIIPQMPGVDTTRIDFNKKNQMSIQT